MVKKPVTQDTPAVDTAIASPGKRGDGEAMPAKQAPAVTSIPKPEPGKPISQSVTRAAAASAAAPRTAERDAEKTVPPASSGAAKSQAAEVKAKGAGAVSKAAPVEGPAVRTARPEQISTAGAEVMAGAVMDTGGPVAAALAADRAAAAQFFGEPVEPPTELTESSASEEAGPVVEVEALVGETAPAAEPPAAVVAAAAPPEPEVYRYIPPPLENKYLNKEALRDRFWLRKAFMPIICYVGRLDFQKGVHLIRHAIFCALQNGAQFVLLGVSPEARINNEFWALKHQLNDSPDCHLEIGFHEELAHLIYAGSDLVVMPSLYEPCGLTQMIALKYGTVPIVRAVGGLVDTVFDRDYSDRPYHERNGYVFQHAEPQDLEGAMRRAIGLWYSYPEEFQQMVINGMKYDYSWNHPGQHYLNIYEYIRCK